MTAKDLAERILGNICACYAEAYPADTCDAQRDEVARMIEGAVPAEGWQPSTLAQQLDAARELVDKYKWQVRDTCRRAEAAEATIKRLAALNDRVIDALTLCRQALEEIVESAPATAEMTLAHIMAQTANEALDKAYGDFSDPYFDERHRARAAGAAGTAGDGTPHSSGIREGQG